MARDGNPVINFPAIPQPLQVAIAQALQVRELGPDFSNMRGYYANSPNQMQFAPAMLYDWLPWGTNGVGVTEYQFFQRNVGGVKPGGTLVTVDDTNMPQASNVGNGVGFLVMKAYVDFRLTVPYVSDSATDATVVSTNALRDLVAIVNGGGNVQFTVNTVPNWGQGMPLKYMLSPCQVACGGGIGTGDAVSIQALAPYVIGGGYDMSDAPFMLHDQLTFGASLKFGTAITLPSGAAGNLTQVGMALEGIWFRPAG